MLLSLRDAATVLGCSPRTLRARLGRGEVAGRKVGGRWQIAKADLPLTRAQHRAVQEKVADLRDAVEAAVPATLKARIGAGRLEDVDVFTETRAMLRELVAADSPGTARRKRRCGKPSTPSPKVTSSSTAQ